VKEEDFSETPISQVTPQKQYEKIKINGVIKVRSIHKKNNNG